MSSKTQITLQAAEGVWGSPAREGVAVVGDVVWCLHPSPLPGSGWVLRKPGPLWCHPAGNRLGKGGGLNPKFATARSWHRRLPRRLCQQQPGARAALCFLTAFMNFNGQLLLDFSSSHCFPAPRSPSGRPFPPRGCSGSRHPPSAPKSSPVSPLSPHRGDLSPPGPGAGGGAAGARVPRVCPVAPGTPVAFPEIPQIQRLRRRHFRTIRLY